MRPTSAQMHVKPSQTRMRHSSSKSLVVMLPSKQVKILPFFFYISIRIHLPLVSDCYISEWKDPRATCPGIKKVYMVALKPDSVRKYEEYRYDFCLFEPP